MRWATADTVALFKTLKDNQMTTRQIALRLIELCSQQKFSAARQELFADDTISIEANGEPIVGLKALNEKEKIWHQSISAIHAIKFSKPLISGNYFSISIHWDLTYKGKERGDWKELAVFEVKDEKVVFEKFYY